MTTCLESTDGWQALRDALQKCTEALEGEWHVRPEIAQKALEMLDKAEREGWPKPKLLPEPDGEVSLTWQFPEVKVYRFFDAEGWQDLALFTPTSAPAPE